MSGAEPAGRDERAEALPRLPPGRHGLSREFVAENQRSRLVAATISVVAERGYQGASVARIAAAAGISRRTFYGFFASKEDCFFAACGVLVTHLRERTAEASAAERAWPERVRARTLAGLEVLAANPDLVRFALIAPSRAGGAVAASFRTAMEEALAELRADRPKRLARKEPSAAADYALLGGAAAMIAAKVEGGEGERLAEMGPELTTMVLAPYLGREQAARVAAGG